MKGRRWTIRIIVFLAVILSIYISWHLLSRKEEKRSIEEKGWEEREEVGGRARKAYSTSVYIGRCPEN